MAGIRCFVAVELPPAMREEIGRLQAGIATEGLRLVKPDLLHITLKFLGDVPEAKIGRVGDALAGIAAAPFPVHVRGTGSFPGRSIRVVWLGLEGELQELYQKVESALLPLGFASEKRGLSAHVTLGRVGQPDADISERLRAKMGQFSETDFGSFTVDRFYLKKSTLTRGGPIYENLRQFPL
ncbi:MAG TPA: RNA 2',3'-cyclic phosphodiesterase [Methanothrix sp.]|nr:RNA 2',3'-cyclic phosphodiesterase [Methanothrix sp.]HPT19442.1 RNA 2',3'-cyclic phosphodiesterase [Methanothrix sp.]